MTGPDDITAPTGAPNPGSAKPARKTALVVMVIVSAVLTLALGGVATLYLVARAESDRAIAEQEAEIDRLREVLSGQQASADSLEQSVVSDRDLLEAVEATIRRERLCIEQAQAFLRELNDEGQALTSFQQVC